MSLGNCVLGKGFRKLIYWSVNDSLNFSVICLIEFKNNQTLLFDICEPRVLMNIVFLVYCKITGLCRNSL